MHFNHYNSHLTNFRININIDNMPIEQKKNVLGVLIDDNLTRNDHLHYVTTCISKSVGIINK